jgi:hypothetical protein
MRGCEAIGVDMTLHQARHVSAYYILDADPNAWTEAAAVLGISISTTKDYYAWMDKRKANDEGRRILREARQKARKHKKGTGLHA